MPLRVAATRRALVLAACGAATLLTARRAVAQADGVPGLEASRLALGTDSLHIYLVRDGRAQRVGMLWDELAALDGGAGRRLRRVYRTRNRLFGDHLDTVVSTLPALRPVSHWTSSEQSRGRVVFGRDRIEGSVAASGRPERLVGRPADPALYDGHTFDLLVRAAALAPGVGFSVPALITSRDSVATLRARVTGSARLRVEGGRTADVWVVEMDFAGLSSTMWIDQRSRRLVRQIIRLAPGVEMLMTVDPGLDGTRPEA